MTKSMAPVISSGDPDAKLLRQLEAAIIKSAGGASRFQIEVPILFRQAFDEVIDTPRSGRFTLDELEKTEKTYIGTKIEILLRNHLKLAKGNVLDLLIEGVEVDVKNTISNNWTIPQEAIGHPCVLLNAREETARCCFGLIVIREELLNSGANRDGKRTITKDGLRHVHWLLHDHPYPGNFWLELPMELRKQITGPRGGTNRVAALFRAVQNRPVSRLIVNGLGQQDDALKRLRRNGGARDQLAREGIAVLWGRKDKELIRQLGLPFCGPAEFIAYNPADSEQVELLRKAGHLD